ncbi:OmpA family protein [Robertkochia solimangrovi]|uniref:OmpA family protein n=1 Tax=Robertkochia solimangrovi TaxID=2213046 RepID=UPI00117DE50F|nr:OmpA family protein [Robertkochia solimangrovi]TRZ46119.1 flagellar motor protein MotB [Robertkochia solimangrovi]
MNVSRLRVLLLLLPWLFNFGYSQDHRLRRADETYEQLDFIKAIRLYERLLHKGYRSETIYENLGNSYYYTSSYEEAAKTYRLLFGMSRELKSDYYFRYAQSLRSSGRYQAADSVMQDYYQKNSAVAVDSSAITGDYRERIRRVSGRYAVTNLPFNSEYSDFGAIYKKDRVIFTSARDTGFLAKKRHSWDYRTFLDLYSIPSDGKGHFGVPAKLSKELNNRFHESNAIFTRDGKRMFYTRNYYEGRRAGRDDAGITRLMIYTAKLDDKGEWVDVHPISICEKGYSTAHPALSPDEKYLFFASDRSGSLGQSDIFYAAILGDDEFGEVKPLKGAVNTGGRESFPFIGDDGQLYFASDGHPGLGGYDIFTAELNDDMYAVHVTNIGAPVNSRWDDFSVSLNPGSREGFFASNREGGKGSDDIYSLVKVEKLRDLKGVLQDSTARVPIAGIPVELRSKDSLLYSVVTDSLGAYSFPDLKEDSEYVIRVDQKEYELKEIQVPEGNDKRFDANLNPVNASATLEELLDFDAIYFAFDRSDINASSASELDKLVAYMKENDGLVLNITSHTDSRGAAAYNLKLSERRAQATRDYLVANGISKDRIEAIGMGEKELINECGDGVKCSAASHRENRRSEFQLYRQTSETMNGNGG